MIEIEGLYKRFGRIQAVEDLTFQVQRGEIVGFLGPNGAGKSTTMRILCGYLPATRGRVELAGHDVARSSREVRAAVGYLPETNPLYPEMRVRDYLRFRSRLKGVPRPRRRAAVGEVVSRCGLEEVQDQLIGTLSRGYRQRVGLADALVHDPEVLVLDEPTVGLDPNQVQDLRRYLKQWAEKRTVILSTHILSEVQALCQRAIVISRGRKVADEPLDRLVSRHGGSMEAMFHALTRGAEA